MAPLATAPEQLLVVLTPNRRRVLLALARDIVAQLRSQYLYDADNSTLLVDWSDDSGAGSDAENGKPAPSHSVPERSVLANKSLAALHEGALAHFDSWAREFLEKLRDLLERPDDQKIQIERRNRSEKIVSARNRRRGNSVVDAKFRAGVSMLQESYMPIPSSFNTVTIEDRKEVVSALLLLHLADGNYSAHASVFMRSLTSSLDLPLEVLATEEKETAQSLIQASAEQQAMSADAETAKRLQRNEIGRFFKVGLASVAGAAVIGITGGLAAPVVAGAMGGLLGSIGLGGVASFLSVFWMNGALVGALFGAYGAQMTGKMMDKYAKEVEDFKFIPLHDDGLGTTSMTRRIRVTIGINGWLFNDDDIAKPWKCLSDDTEAFALRYEMKSLLKLGNALEGLVASYAWKTVKMEILKRTVLASLWAALWPAYIISMATNIDNPFSLARNRSDKAGRVLADALINKVQGERPVTLVGYSLGARVIYSCLKSLADRQAYGLIDTVVLIGTPAPSDRVHWLAMKSVVSGRIHNVYSSNDLILGFMYRTSSLQLGIAGLQDIQNVKGVQNIDLSEYVGGHLRYPRLVNKILARCGFIGIAGGSEPIEQDEEIATIKNETAPKEAPDTNKPPPPPPRPRPSVPPKDPVKNHPDPDITLLNADTPPPPPPKPTNYNFISHRPLSLSQGHPRPPSVIQGPQSQPTSPQSPHLPQSPRRNRPPNFLADFLQNTQRAFEDEFHNPGLSRSHTFQPGTPRRSRGRGIFAEKLDSEEDIDDTPPLPRLPVNDVTNQPMSRLHRSATMPVPGKAVHPFLQNSEGEPIPKGPLGPFAAMLSPVNPYPEESESEEEPEGAPIRMMDNDSK